MIEGKDKTLIKGWDQSISKMYQNSPTTLGKWNWLLKSLLSIKERKHRPILNVDSNTRNKIVGQN